MPLTQGDTIGQYRLISRLGRGGMAEVWKAYQPRLNRHVAIKIIRPDVADDPTFISRFRREAAILAGLQHPHILLVFDFDEHQGSLYLVSPFIEGTDLQKSIDNPWPVSMACQVLRPIANALDYAHRQDPPVIHRDVKPGNILLAHDGRVILADFGIAKLMDQSPIMMRLTRAGDAPGTPGYMAPEQIERNDVSPRSDQYSLAIVAYQLLTGRLPFDCETPKATAAAQLRDPVPPPSTLNPKIGQSVELALLKALEKDPNNRFQSATEFVNALSIAADDAYMIGQTNVPYGFATPGTTIQPTQQPFQEYPATDAGVGAKTPGEKDVSRRRLPWRAIVVAAILLVGTSIAYMARGPGTQDRPPAAQPTQATTAAVPTQPTAPIGVSTTTPGSVVASRVTCPISPADAANQLGAIDSMWQSGGEDPVDGKRWIVGSERNTEVVSLRDPKPGYYYVGSDRTPIREKIDRATHVTYNCGKGN